MHKLKTKDPLAFLADHSVDDLKHAITCVVVELAMEYERLQEARKYPKPLEDADKRLLGTERKDLTTIDLTEWRIATWEASQDRLWHWYRTKNAETKQSSTQR